LPRPPCSPPFPYPTLFRPPPLPGVFGPVGRGDHHPAVTGQFVPDVHGGVALGAGQEGPAVAAVEEQDDGAGPAAAHLRVQERGRDGRGGEQAGVGVGGGEVQFAAVVLDAVAGQVQQEQVVAAAVAEEDLDGPGDLVVAAVDDRADLEV